MTTDPIIILAVVFGSLLLVLLTSKSRNLGDFLLGLLIIPGLCFIFPPLYDNLGTTEHLKTMELTLVDFILLGLPLMIFVLAVNNLNKRKKTK